MQKNRYKKTSVNIENNLYLMAIGEGIELTAFINNCLALFFEVPPDPHQNLIKEKSEYSVLRLKEKYLRDVHEIIKEHAAQTSIDQEARDREAELIQFGEYLKKTTAFPVFLRGLAAKDPDEDSLRLVTREVNKMNGHSYTEDELWNKAIDWHRKYGKVAA